MLAGNFHLSRKTAVTTHKHARTNGKGRGEFLSVRIPDAQLHVKFIALVRVVAVEFNGCEPVIAPLCKTVRFAHNGKIATFDGVKHTFE